jgi:hypothetical protein
MYVGQTDGHISARISKHIRDTSLESQPSPPAEGSAERKHSIGFDRTESIVNTRTYRPHIISEATEITKYSHNSNCEVG